MLSWLLSKCDVEKAMDGDIADETAVEVCPEKVAWLLVKNVNKQVEKIRHGSAMFARMMLKKRVCPVTLV